ncbi:MAG: uracil-DNA glycosylase [Puniceicoccales bacterium]|jgi:DNA polymerase|nr:uracil-DNA glycosylase [Puniceicoccales bacterium]
MVTDNKMHLQSQSLSYFSDMAHLINVLVEALESLKKQGQKVIPIGAENFAFLKEGSITLPRMTQRSPQNQIQHPLPEIDRYEKSKIIAATCGSTQTFTSKREHWEDLRRRVLGNEDLKKHVHPGKNLVFGVGNLEAKIFFCGEAPGADEEIQGIPFVGRAGQLLTKIIMAMGLSREEVYIGNIMNWRPEMDGETGNRPPTQEEMQFCLPYLIEQVEIVQPKVIVALGATAVSSLLGYDRNRKMSTIRGRWYEFCDIPLMITFHPSYLLRNGTNTMKRVVWEDMLQVMERVGLPISTKQRQYFLEK